MYYQVVKLLVEAFVDMAAEKLPEIQDRIKVKLAIQS
jgi:hypothetical protein